MNLNAIVVNHLRVYGFDGLFCQGECACEIDDLAPCGHANFEQCKPGFKVACQNDDTCECSIDRPRLSACWRIQSEKPEQGGEE